MRLPPFIESTNRGSLRPAGERPDLLSFAPRKLPGQVPQYEHRYLALVPADAV